MSGDAGLVEEEAASVRKTQPSSITDSLYAVAQIKDEGGITHHASVDKSIKNGAVEKTFKSKEDTHKMNESIHEEMKGDEGIGAVKDASQAASTGNIQKSEGSIVDQAVSTEPQNSLSSTACIESHRELSQSLANISTILRDNAVEKEVAFETPSFESAQTKAKPAPLELQDMESIVSTKTVIDNDQDLNSVLGERDLPAPPAPSKDSDYADKAEMRDVAKAFGVQLKLTDEVGDKLQNGHNSVLDVPFSPSSSTQSASSSKSGIRIGKGPPPKTQASEEKPFDFNRFLDQMRHKSAGPVGEYVRSFIKGFTKKPYRVSDQTKLIFDFLDFIALRMKECEVWAKLTNNEFDNAIEAMEKLLMNRLYNYTFSPAVKKEGKWNVQTDDLERDRVLKQRIRLFSWITEEHLDVPVGSHSKGFLDFAIEELFKINHYKAPRDKVICILNCCKVIFGLIRHLSSEENADTFIPILIQVVLQANPDNLISNVEYISRFRNPERLSSESGYYLSSLMGAIAFIETMDYTSLSNITQQEFEAKVEEAVEKLSTQPDSMENSPAQAEFPVTFTTEKIDERATLSSRPPSSNGNEEVARNLPISAGAAAIAEDTKAFFQRTGEAARAGIGASLGKPMGALGRLFQEGLDGPRTPGGGSSSALSSGRVTPDGPQVITTPGATFSTSETNSARSRMWNLFGVDDEEAARRREQQQKSGSAHGPRAVSTTSSLNFGSWSRNMREDEDPQTPLSEELIQGKFAPLDSRDKTLSGAPRAQQQQLQQQQRTPHRQTPERMGSVDPYSIQDDGVMASGVRTPDNDADESEVELSSPSNVARPRLSNLGGFLPSFLSDPQLGRQPSNQQHQYQQKQQSRRGSNRDPSSGNDSFNDEEAARATAEIEQAHINAGVETLKSIFPSVESSVCKLVLEGCQGDVQASIDKLLEMQ